jgi:hypothetical protein
MTWNPDGEVPRRVHAVERAYVAAATGRAEPGAPAPGAFASAAAALHAPAYAGAVASRYLAVGTPRTIGIVIGESLEEALASLVAHHTWFRYPRVRWTGPRAHEAALLTGEVVPLAEVLTSDIVCIHAATALAAHQLRRGTHVNALAEVALDVELRRLATIVDEPSGLPALAAGLVDGRQLDEITVFVAGGADIAAAALARLFA